MKNSKIMTTTMNMNTTKLDNSIEAVGVNGSPHQAGAGFRGEYSPMNSTKSFFLTEPVEGHFYQTAFFMLVHDIARLSALGKSPKAAYEQAMLAVANLGLSVEETAQFDDLRMILHDDRHLDTSFLMNGKTVTARVAWTQDEKYPTVC